jgi:hypothetical protein
MTAQHRPLVVRRPHRVGIRGIIDEWQGDGRAMPDDGTVREWTLSRVADGGRMKLALRPQPPSGDCPDLRFDDDYRAWLSGEGVIVIGADGERIHEIGCGHDCQGIDLYLDRSGMLHIGEHRNDDEGVMARRITSLRHTLSLDNGSASMLIRGVESVRVSNIGQHWHADDACPDGTAVFKYDNGIITMDPGGDLPFSRELLIRRTLPDIGREERVPQNGQRLFRLPHASIVQTTTGTRVLQQQWTLRFDVRERRLTVEQGVASGPIHTAMLLSRQ